MDKFKVVFNSHNVFHTLAALVLALTAAAGITTTDSASFFATGTVSLVTIKALGAFVLFRVADEFKNGTLIDKLKANGKLSWHKALAWLQGAVLAGGMANGIIQPDALSNIHNVSWMALAFAVVTTFKTLYTHYVANVTVNTPDPVLNAATSASK
jgi:NADH:ubiquinone oxidoreductase subunit 6 (subunit J)